MLNFELIDSSFCSNDFPLFYFFSFSAELLQILKKEKETGENNAKVLREKLKISTSGCFS